VTHWPLGLYIKRALLRCVFTRLNARWSGTISIELVISAFPGWGRA